MQDTPIYRDSIQAKTWFDSSQLTTRCLINSFHFTETRRLGLSTSTQPPAMATEFHYFPLLPFEIRQLIWEQVAFQDASVHVPCHITKALLRWKIGGTIDPWAQWTSYMERDSRAPAMAHACQQARAAALRHPICCHAPSEMTTTTSCGSDDHDSGLPSWQVMLDVLLLHDYHPSPLLMLGNQVKTFLAGVPCVALLLAAFLRDGTSPAYKFEFVNRTNKCTSLTTKIVVQMLDMQILTSSVEARRLFGKPQQESPYQIRLVNVRNKSLRDRFFRAAPNRVLTWPQLDHGHHHVNETTSDFYVDQEIAKLEDYWLDCQYSTWFPRDKRRKEEVLHIGNKQSRYRRDHEWVQMTLERMPSLEPVILFSTRTW